MSRNVRRKFPTASVKASKRRGSDSSSSLNLSSDDGYSGVEDVSDSEDEDEDDVDAVEEENIMARAMTSPRPQQDSAEGSEDEDSVDEDDGVNEDDDDDDDYSSIIAGLDNDDEHDDSSWKGIPSSPEVDISDFYNEAAFQATKCNKQVRFDLSSSDTDTETEDESKPWITDLFVSQDRLDTKFRREIEAEDDDSSSSVTCWDHADESALGFSSVVLPAQPSPSPDAPLAPSDLDGYETDGDTTEEEDIPEPVIRRRTRRPSPSVSEDTDSEIEVTPKHQRGQPRLGRFNLDRSARKPIAVANPATGKMMIFTAQQRQQLFWSPPPLQPLQPLHEPLHDLAWPVLDQSDPLFTQPGQVMMSALTAPLFAEASSLATYPSGPHEAFFSGIGADAETSSENDHEFWGGLDPDEEKLTYADFIRDDSEDEDDDDQSCFPSSTPARPTTASSEVDRFNYMNPSTVGAFRRGQDRSRLLSGGDATDDSIALSGPFHATTIKGLKPDRLDTAAAPLTPVRRQKKTPIDFARSPLEAVSNKRKASAEVAESSAAGHKKQRSISDVNQLRI